MFVELNGVVVKEGGWGIGDGGWGMGEGVGVGTFLQSLLNCLLMFSVRLKNMRFFVGREWTISPTPRLSQSSSSENSRCLFIVRRVCRPPVTADRRRGGDRMMVDVL